MPNQQHSKPITRSSSTQALKYTNFRPPVHRIRQRQLVPKPATTKAIKSDSKKYDEYTPMVRVIDMSGMDVSSFPDVVLMKASQMSRFSRQKQDSFIKKNKGAVDHDGWAKGRYCHPKFRKGPFVEVDNIQIHQCSNALSFAKVGGMIIHKPLANKRVFPVSKQVAEQRKYSREDSGSQDTNIGHKTKKVISADRKAARAVPPGPKLYKGYTIPNKFQPLTYENVDFSLNDDLFQFFGDTGSTVAQDISDFSSFYDEVDGEFSLCYDDDVAADYVDLLVNYTNNNLSDSLSIKNTFRFWGDARRFRDTHPMFGPVIGPVPVVNTYTGFSEEQLVSFNADNMDDDTISNSDTIVSVADTILSVVQTSSTTKPKSKDYHNPTRVHISELDDDNDDELDKPFFPDSSVLSSISSSKNNSSLIDITIPVDDASGSVASFEELPRSLVSDDSTDLVVHNGSFAEYGKVATPDKVSPAKRSTKIDKQLSHEGSALGVSTSKKRKREETVSIKEHEALIDHFDAEKNDILRERAEVGQVNGQLRREVERLTKQVKELTLSDSKWRDRAIEARYDLKYMINSSAATVEVLSAGMALQGFQTLDLVIVNKAIKKSGQGLRNIKIQPIDPEAVPQCLNKCFSNKNDPSTGLCLVCQFQITASSAVVLLKDSYDQDKLNTQTTPDEWLEGPNFGVDEFDHNRKDGHVVEVTQLPEVLKRKHLSVGSLVNIKRKFGEGTDSAPKQSNREDNALGQNTSSLDSVSTVNMPDLGCLNDFQQSTTKLSQECLKESVVDIEGSNFKVTSTPRKTQGFVFGIQAQRIGPETAGMKLQAKLKNLVKGGMAHAEAAKFCQVVHPELIKEVERETESDEKFSQ